MLGDVPNISNAFTRIEFEFLICNHIRNINIRRFLPWKHPLIGLLSFAWRALSRCKTLTLWLGADGIGFLLRSSCLPVCAGRHHRGEQARGLAEDSSFWCPLWRKMVRKKALGSTNEMFHICLVVW